MILCHLTCLHVVVLMQVQFFFGGGGTTHLKFWRAKTSKIWCDVNRQTFDLDCEYLWNAQIYRQAVNCDINGDSFPVEQNKFGELWSTNKKLQAHMLTYPKSILDVLRMLMHLSSSHLNLPPGEFHPHEFPPTPIGLRVPGGPMVGFAPNFQFTSFSIVNKQTSIQNVNFRRLLEQNFLQVKYHYLYQQIV